MQHVDCTGSHRFRTYPNTPNVDYPEGFQGTQIPVYAPAVTQIVEARVSGRVL